MKILSTHFFTIAALSFTATQALAEDLVVAGKVLHVALPHGYCAMHESGNEQLMVRHIRMGLQPRIHLLTVFARCETLSKWQSSDPGSINGLDDYGTIAIPVGSGTVSPVEDISRTEFIKSLSIQLKPVDQPEVLAGIRRTEERLRALRPWNDKITNLGIIDLDSNALYIGAAISQSIKNQQGEYKQNTLISIN